MVFESVEQSVCHELLYYIKHKGHDIVQWNIGDCNVPVSKYSQHLYQKALL